MKSRLQVPCLSPTLRSLAWSFIFHERLHSLPGLGAAALVRVKTRPLLPLLLGLELHWYCQPLGFALLSVGHISTQSTAPQCVCMWEAGILLRCLEDAEVHRDSCTPIYKGVAFADDLHTPLDHTQSPVRCGCCVCVLCWAHRGHDKETLSTHARAA